MNQLNNNLFYAINHFAGQVQVIDWFFIIAANFSPILLILFILYRWFFSKQLINSRQRIFLAGLSFVFAELLGKIAGLLYNHPQPFVHLTGVHQLVNHAVDNAFPSDHSLLFFSIMSLLFLTSQSKYRSLYLVSAILVGLARIWVGVHYPIDVVASGLIGFFSSSCILWLNHKLAWLNLINQKISHFLLPKFSQRRH
ncbi:undecaprenyl-diphosphatase [Enterococcus sp. ALS3]|uniref:Undecaprenyl-diphosphatase n=1 Tax=Enterococcus alishanensis TaxID=1303817 RepID=A0ABS6TGQ9_9ENTE|nr:undecaprenyl-diphosphatase [Enterococcus alishanensis]MBV7392078.1 undecaprenyl-diphosphatase [Enterococcus alishanensis]